MLRWFLVFGLLVGAWSIAVLSGTADAGKPQVQLSYQLYEFADGTFKVDYIVKSKGGGGMDLAVSHQCFSDGVLVQNRTNRLYWSGNGANAEGHWNLAVEDGTECTAVVVDLDQEANSGATALSGFVAVSAPVSYTVQ